MQKPSPKPNPTRMPGDGSLSREEIIEIVLAKLADGGVLWKILKDPAMPHMTTWHAWLEADPDLAQRYARARRIGAEAIAMEAFQIAEDVAADKQQIARAKLRVDTRLRLLSKWAPETYGDKVQVSGHDGAAVKVEQTHSVAPDVMRELAAALLKKDA